jgi:hypothetical protein
MLPATLAENSLRLRLDGRYLICRFYFMRMLTIEAPCNPGVLVKKQHSKQALSDQERAISSSHSVAPAEEKPIVAPNS